MTFSFSLLLVVDLMKKSSLLSQQVTLKQLFCLHEITSSEKWRFFHFEKVKNGGISTEFEIILAGKLFDERKFFAT
jgi:hypothetical protein